MPIINSKKLSGETERRRKKYIVTSFETAYQSQLICNKDYYSYTHTHTKLRVTVNPAHHLPERGEHK